MGLDNKDYNLEQFSKYYSHPVWFLNGLFIETDSESMRHRRSIAEYFKGKKKIKNIGSWWWIWNISQRNCKLSTFVGFFYKELKDNKHGHFFYKKKRYLQKRFK